MALDLQMKILVVEDSNITRIMEINLLKELGFSDILEANDGDVAIEKLIEENADVDLIISDWNMPKMSGFELLEWVRSDAQFRHIPFIIASAQAEKKQRDKAIEAGVSNFITKPFSPEELKSVIEKTMSLDDSLDDEDLESHEPVVTDSGKVILNVAHIQITDHLVLGVLKYLIETKQLTPKHFELKTHCMTSWNPVQSALEKGKVEAALILAPIAMDLFSYGVPIQMILLAHKNGSISIRNTKGEFNSDQTLEQFLSSKTFYIPHILSIHHMLTDIMLTEIGLIPGLSDEEGVNVFLEVIPPVQMPVALEKNETVGGYLVAEPLGTKAISAGTGDLMFFSGELWQNHPCCIVAMQQKIIHGFEDAVQEFTNMLVQAGMVITRKPDLAAEIAVSFLDPKKKLGLKKPILERVLKEPMGIKTDDLYPVIQDLDMIQKYMVERMGYGTLIDINKFVNTQFADIACGKMAIGKQPHVAPNLSENIAVIMKRLASHFSQKQSVAGLKATEKEKIHLNVSATIKHDEIIIESHKALITSVTYQTNPLGFIIWSQTSTGCDMVLISTHIDNHTNDVETIQSYLNSHCEANLTGTDFFNGLQDLIPVNGNGTQFSGSYIHIDLLNQKGEITSIRNEPALIIKPNFPMPRPINYETVTNQTDLSQMDLSQFSLCEGMKLLIYNSSVSKISNANSVYAVRQTLYPDGLDDVIHTCRQYPIKKMIPEMFKTVSYFCNNTFEDNVLMAGIEF